MLRNRMPRLTTVILIAVYLVTAAIFPVVAQTQQRLNIAVLELEITGGLPEVYAKTMSDRLRLELLNTGMFNVAERNAMEAILEEQGFQLSGCTSDECAVEVGRLLGTDKVIAGSVGRINQTHSIILRMIDIETGQIEKSRNVDCVCPIDEVFSVRLRQAALLMAGLDNAAWLAGGGQQDPVKHALPRSLLWPGLGQLAVGRKTTGVVYAIGEGLAVGFVLIAVSNYNGKVHNYIDAKEDYDQATDPTRFDVLYKERMSAHDEAESAETMITVSGIIAGGFYLWNVIDAALFGAPQTDIETASAPENLRSSLNLAIIHDGSGKPAPGVSYGIRFGSTGRAER